MVTQYAGVRPYGVGLLVAGINDGPTLFETDPLGTMIEWKAQAIGRGAIKAKKILDEAERKVIVDWTTHTRDEDLLERVREKMGQLLSAASTASLQE